MKILIYGATGMVGQGVLREAIHASDVNEILCVGRRPVESASAKVSNLIVGDLFDHDTIAPQITGFDACFFCIGTTSFGKPEFEYKRLTYDLALTIAKGLLPQNPELTFVYVSGQGADSTESGKIMWARVRGKLENSLFKLGFKSAHSLRPGYIQPLDGIKSKTALYRLPYAALGFAYPLLKKLFPNAICSTRTVGQAMLQLARVGSGPRILEAADINRLASSHQ